MGEMVNVRNRKKAGEGDTPVGLGAATGVGQVGDVIFEKKQKKVRGPALRLCGKDVCAEGSPGGRVSK